MCYAVRSGDLFELQTRYMRLWKSRKGGSKRGRCAVPLSTRRAQAQAEQRITHRTLRGRAFSTATITTSMTTELDRVRQNYTVIVTVGMHLNQ